MTLKRAQVVMLSTEKAENFNNQRQYPCILKHSWMFDKDETGKLIFTDCNIRTPTLLQHLYILSDDEIREGDCCYDNGTIYKIKDKKHLLVVLNFGNAKKIIATTDSSLTTGLNNCDGCLAGKLVDIHGYHAMGENGKHLDLMICQKDKYIKCLPQPSEDFIRVYVEAYNKNDIIKYVDVDYIHSRPGDCGCRGMVHDGCGWADDVYDLKVNSKNEISIRKIKETWSRDEVKLAFMNFLKDNGLSGISGVTVNKWIEQNL